VLYALRPDAWGRGYATEIAMVSVAHARRVGVGEVIGMTATDNRASRRVLERAGVRFERTFTRAGLPHWLGRLRPIV
jgi:RimJ/RimL family protein N-acetyltransferase